MSEAKRWRVAEVVRYAVSTAVARLDANEPALWTERDPEAVHQARVASRRLRSDLGTLGDFVNARWAKQLRGELRWIGAELGQVRDVEVLRERLTLHAGLLPDADADAARSGIRRLDADHTTARTELLRTLRQPRYAQLHRALHDAVVAPRLTPAADMRANDALPGVVRPTWRKVRRAVEALGREPSDAALHQVRIRSKRCRYASDSRSRSSGAPREFAAQMAHLQDVLGEHQDAVVADAWLAKTAPECSPAEAYALGILAEIERGLAVRARAAFASALEVRRPAPIAAILAVTKAGDQRVVRAAGGLVTRPAGAGVEVLVVHRPRYDDWSLPKGKAESGETDEATARREVEEETGYVCALGEELTTVRYTDRRGRAKQVRYWYMTVEREADWAPNDEVDERRWCSPGAAATLLSYDADRRLVDILNGPDVREDTPG